MDDFEDEFEEEVRNDPKAQALYGYHVSSDKLFEVIQNTPEVSDATKARVIEIFKEKVTRGARTVDSMKLGFAMVKLPDFQEIGDKEGIVRIMGEIDDLDKLPIVSVRGTPVG